jgi:hypothetical protein
MKTGVIFYHKNSHILYKERWINKCIMSILNQTYQEFSIYELNYGGDKLSIFKGYDLKNDILFYNEVFNNHAEAMNFIIDKAFYDGCEIVFNTNIDDFYSENRFREQVEIIKMGYDLVSSDFYYVKDFIDEEDKITNDIKVSNQPVGESLKRNHNVIAHPCVAISKKFWSDNRYEPNEIPMEDLLLWKRAIEGGSKFYIIPEKLLFYRIHENQISSGPTKETTLQKVKENEKITNNEDPVWIDDYSV